MNPWRSIKGVGYEYDRFLTCMILLTQILLQWFSNTIAVSLECLMHFSFLVGRGNSCKGFVFPSRIRRIITVIIEINLLTTALLVELPTHVPIREERVSEIDARNVAAVVLLVITVNAVPLLVGSVWYTIPSKEGKRALGR
ncbi:hypothetical protein V2J09_008782 [Rumex salicifolius]